MNQTLEGKIAFVTGASRGLGRAICRHLSDAGARGLAFDSSTNFDNLPLNWLSHEGDVRDEKSIADALGRIEDSFGQLNIVVANAGIVPPWSKTETIDLEEWDRVFAVNVRGVLSSIKQSIPLMKRTGGSMIAMGSLNSYRGHPHQCLYVASKHAVLGIVRSTALDLGQFGIRVNALGPGPVPTEALLGRIQERSSEAGSSWQDTLSHLHGQTALGRMATEDEVAMAVVFLASEQSSGFTGQLFPIDAGLA